MRTTLLLAVTLLVAACGGLPAECPNPAYPNPTPEGLCCDAAWSWCVDGDGRIVGAP